jgi:hypothetical protein
LRLEVLESRAVATALASPTEAGNGLVHGSIPPRSVRSGATLGGVIAGCIKPLNKRPKCRDNV